MKINILSRCDHVPPVPDASARRRLLNIKRLLSIYKRFCNCGTTQISSQAEQFETEQPNLIRLMAAFEDRLTPTADSWQAFLGLSIWQCFREQFPNVRRVEDRELELLGQELTQMFLRPSVCFCGYHQNEAMDFASMTVACLATRGEVSAEEGVLITYTTVLLIEALDRASAAPLPRTKDQRFRGAEQPPLFGNNTRSSLN